MATSQTLGYPLWADGMEWTSLLQRQFGGGAAVWDSNASSSDANPLGGVFAGPGKPLCVTQQASPNMSVLVNAGYCAVPHPTQGHGVYLFGNLTQGTLTVAANSSGQARVDIVVARVYDEDDSGSYCDIEIIEGTPAAGQPATPTASILLAAIAVANGATSITTSNITDKRTFTVAPGGVLPASTANAPALAQGQVLWNTTESLLQRATPPVYYEVSWSSGSGTWVSPLDGTIRVQGNGAGGGASEATASATDGSGGAGEYAEEPEYPVVLDGSYDWSVGDSGIGGFDNDGPGTGTATTFTGAGGTVTANGGQAGQATTGGGTGKGGTGSTNTIHFDGGSGVAVTSGLGGAGGGGAAGPGGPGGDGSAPDGSRGGAGGNAPPAAGSGGQGGSEGQYGAQGGFPGGGGGMSGYGGGSEFLQGADGANGQLILSWEITPTALQALASAEVAESDVVTSTGTAGSQGLNAASGSGYGWGIGYGATTDEGGGFFGFGRSGFNADGQLVQQIQQQFTADGSTDFAFDARWGIAVPEAAADSSSPSISSGQLRVMIMVDGTVLDTVYLRCAASGGVTQPGDAGSFTYYTSAILGTTPAAGTHTVSLAIESEHTSSGSYSGAHVGNLASVSQSSHPFGSVPTYYQESLTAEHSYIRVSSLAATL